MSIESVHISTYLVLSPLQQTHNMHISANTLVYLHTNGLLFLLPITTEVKPETKSSIQSALKARNKSSANRIEQCAYISTYYSLSPYQRTFVLLPSTSGGKTEDKSSESNVSNENKVSKVKAVKAMRTKCVHASTS